MRKDTGGAFWDIALDIASVVVGVAEVVAEPNNAIAKVSLLTDLACALIPGVTGGGALVRGIAKSDDVIDAARAIYLASDKASDIRKATGSYEIVYKNGTTYVGKGGYKRAINSAKRHSKGTTVSSINWTKASTHREDFINEYMSMCQYGGPNNRTIGNLNSHNSIWSPGRKYYYEDYGNYYRCGGKLW